MLKNYLLIAIRNLKKNKVFSFINILGLALGMACSLLILLWVQDERNINRFHANGDRLYCFYERQYYDNKIEGIYSTPPLMPDELKRVLPQVQYATGFAWTSGYAFQVGEKSIKEDGNYASADFFNMFSYPLLQGKANTALNTPSSIAISRKMANDFFGSPENAMGKTIRLGDRKDFNITAVFENLPDLASEKFDYLLNWDFFIDENKGWAKDWGNNGPRTFVALRPGTDPVAFEKKITHFLDNYNKQQGASFHVQLGIQRFDETYLHSEFKNGQITGGRIEYVRLFSIIAIFILLIACINFMNLTTARSIKRAKEIGIRKVVGAIRGALVRQFIGEAILLAFISVIVAILMAWLMLPTFNQLTNKHIRLPLTQINFWLSIIGLTLITGFISGSYPALFLSAFNPVKVLKGTLRFSPKAALFRKGLVIFQFVLSIMLIIGTIIISKQINYIQTMNLGYDRENLVYMPINGDLAKQYQLFKDEASKIPGVKMVSRVSQGPVDIENGTGGVDWEGKDQNVRPMFTQISVGYDFAKTMNIKMASGRDFSKQYPTDSVGYILNEAALSKINYKNPVGMPLTFWRKKGKIIGVMKDFHFNSLHEQIKPLVVRLGENDDYGNVLIRIEAGKTKQALAGLETLSKQINPKFPFAFRFSDEDYQQLYTSEQVIGKLSNYFSFLAIFISCLGLLGLAMFTAEQRTKEIGIRKVLGASAGSVFTLLSKEFLVFVVLALIIASPLAWLMMNKWLQQYAYRTNINLWIFVLAGCFAILIALFTVSFQAIKSAVANPVKSLRTE